MRQSGSEAATLEAGRIPPAADKYHKDQNILDWTNENFKRHGDIFKASVHAADSYVVCDPEYAHHILRTNWQNYEKGEEAKRVAFLVPDGILVSEGEFWKQQRQMIQPAFRRDAIYALADDIVSANVALLQRWEEAAQQKAPINVTHDTSLMVLENTLRAIFGRDYEQVAPHFKMLSDETVRNLLFAQKFRSLDRIVMQIVEQRRTKDIASSDILGILMQARERHSGRPMADRQLIREIMTLILAGHEATATSLNWAWYLLSKHPEVEEKLSQELSTLSPGEFPDVQNLATFTYTLQVMDEVLRLYPAGWLMARRAIKDDQLGEYFVPAGTEINISIYAIQRNPKLWNAPDRFDPDRFGANASQDRHPLSMLPFSAGPRNCIGEFLARVEMQIHLMTIGSRLRLRGVDDKPLELDVGVNLRSKHDFMMSPEIRNPTAC